jgi:serine/threonine protein kinase/tetratricopeptide (TPR) repeat protein
VRTAIGRYAVTGTLGEGGMGVVYAAFDDRLGRPVAIKMIKAAVSEPAARDRLQREARSAASVNHPAICQLYEIGEDNGELFLAMELLQGESLAARIGRGVLGIPEVVSTAIGILSGIEALHKQGLVHRDLKPSHIFLTPHGVKLLDFGLTCGLQLVADETLARLTVPGTVVGTPQYAAPEQLRGQSVDGRTDLFAAGVVLYEMLAGKPPFGGDSAVEVFHAIMYEQPPVLTGSPAVAALDRVVNHALAKRPEDRYQSVEAMAQDIRSALTLGDPASSGAVARAHAVTRLIVLPFRVLRSDPETDFLAFSLADAVTSGLSGLQSLVVRSSLAASRFATGGPDLKAIAVEAEVDAVLVGTLLRAGDQLRVSSQLLEAPGATVLWSNTAQVPVGDLFRLQDELTGKIVESLSLPLTTRERRLLKQDVPASPRVYDLFLRANEMSRETSQWPAALELYERCVQEDPHYAPAWAGVGRMHRMIGKYVNQETADRFTRAESALKRALDLNPDLSVAEKVYAHLEVDLGRAEQSMVRLLKRARERRSDPELFAGLSHALRYCGLLQASMAAAAHARRLDPAVRVSAGHTCFMLGDYEGVLDYEQEGLNYMRNLALIMLNRTDDALASLKATDTATPNLLANYVRSLLRLLEGNIEGSLAEVRSVMSIQDPEGRFYGARHLAHLGDHAGALKLLSAAVDDGYFCVPAFARDPWLDDVRGTPEFAEIVRRAEVRHRQALISFLTGEGDRILGLTNPV